MKQGGRSTSFPRELSRSDRAGGYSYSRGRQSHSGSRHVSEQGVATQWHSRERKQNGRPRILDIVPALSGKKSGVVSLNHLLNFTFAPRDTSAVSSYRPKQAMSRSGMVYNKEQFLQAKLVVSSAVCLSVSVSQLSVCLYVFLSLCMSACQCSSKDLKGAQRKGHNVGTLQT